MAKWEVSLIILDVPVTKVVEADYFALDDDHLYFNNDEDEEPVAMFARGTWTHVQQKADE